MLGLLLPSQVKAEDNDLLAPLTPSKKAPAVKRKPAAPAVKKGRLSVNVPGVPDATLLIDDEDLGTVPSQPVSLPAGTHQVVVRRPGYADFIRTLSVRPGKLTEITAQLEPNAGTLAVETEPSNAQVIVDGQPMGQTPVKNLVLPSGTYELTLRKDGYRDEVARVSIRLGKQQSLRLSLIPLQQEVTRPPVASLPEPRSGFAPLSDLDSDPSVATRVEPQDWYKRWYVWAGAAAVVAGTVTTVLIVRSANGRQPLSVVCGGAAPCGSF